MNNKSAVKEGRIPVFKERFREIVEQAGGIAAFAEKVKISRQSVGFWYNGDRVPDAERLIILSQNTGCSVDYLLGRTNIKSPDPNLKAACDYIGLSEDVISVIKGLLPGTKLVLGEYVKMPEFLDLLRKLKAMLKNAEGVDFCTKCTAANTDSEFEKVSNLYSALDRTIKEYSCSRYEAIKRFEGLVDRFNDHDNLLKAAEDARYSLAVELGKLDPNYRTLAEETEV